MNLSEGWAIFIASVIVSAVISVFQALVIKRLDKMERVFDRKFEENEVEHNRICSDNTVAHEKIWIEHNKSKLDACERLAGLEKQLEIEERIKKLIAPI